MKTSLKDIAEELRLSKTTVSWVLSGRGNERGISQATQDRVKQCARRMNYQPNLLARSLNTGVSSTIGLILPSISDSFYSQVAREVEMEAERHGYSLMICSSESEGERENRMIRMFRAKQVDGIILAPTKISKTEIRQLVDDAFPLVVFDRYFSELKTHYIIIDNEQSSYRLVSHLIERGARRIAIVTTNPHLTTMDQRRAGYARALTEAGLPVDPDLYGEAAKRTCSARSTGFSPRRPTWTVFSLRPISWRSRRSVISTAAGSTSTTVTGWPVFTRCLR